MAIGTAAAVRYPLRSSVWLRCAAWGWVLAGAVVGLLWAWLGAGGAGERGLRWSVAGLVWCISVLAAWDALRRVPLGLLYWDGQGWYWERADGGHVPWPAPHVVLDTRALLVLHFASGYGGGHTVVLEPQWAPGQWGHLRRAVYSSPPAPPAQEASPSQ